MQNTQHLVPSRECASPSVSEQRSKYDSNFSKADRTCPSSKSNVFDFFCQTYLILLLSKINCRSRYAQTANFGCFFVRRKQNGFLFERFLVKNSRFRVSIQWVLGAVKSSGQAHPPPSLFVLKTNTEIILHLRPLNVNHSHT